MPSELTIDTNVFAHCYDPRNEKCMDALALVNAVKDGGHKLCVDEGFHPIEAHNRSVIGTEYVQRLRAGSPGLALVAYLASNGRVRILPRRASREVNRRLVRLVGDSGDRAFVAVAWHSADRILVSHDYADFPEHVRTSIADEFSVDIVDADICLSRLG
jgi:hypothetical protein